MAYFFGPRCTC